MDLASRWLDLCSGKLDPSDCCERLQAGRLGLASEKLDLGLESLKLYGFVASGPTKPPLVPYKTRNRSQKGLPTHQLGPIDPKTPQHDSKEYPFQARNPAAQARQMGRSLYLSIYLSIYLYIHTYIHTYC